MNEPLYSLPPAGELPLEHLYVKVVEMLQQNWALVAPGTPATVWFFDDGAQVFDQLTFADTDTALKALQHNRFGHYADPEENFADFIPLPKPNFRYAPRPVYSSGQYWR